MNQRSKGPARLAMVVALAALTTMGSVVAAPSATAVTQPYISSKSGGASLRYCPNTGCGRYGVITNGNRVGMLCWRDAQWVYPPNSNYASNRWFYVYAPSLNADGWVHSSLVAGQVSTPPCPSTI